MTDHSDGDAVRGDGVADIDVVLVTGLSGAGRGTAAKVLEDLGWYVADNLPPELIAQMVDPKRFLTPNGVSSMDMQAPNYNPDGYWNGGIWPVLQWYLWRGLLEAGQPALATQVYAASLLAITADQPAEQAYLADLARRTRTLELLALAGVCLFGSVALSLAITGSVLTL
jgi:hypothetical protein